MRDIRSELRKIEGVEFVEDVNSLTNITVSNSNNTTSIYGIAKSVSDCNNRLVEIFNLIKKLEKTVGRK